MVMKNILTAVLFTLFAASPTVAWADVASTPAAPSTQKTQIKVSGLHCSSCAKEISANLNKVKGVQSVSWNKKSNLVEITYQAGSTTPADLLQTVNLTADDDGFKAAVVQ
jgi:copper chaperone CopZ